MIKKYILLIVLLLLQGCESSPVRRQQMLAEHPEWDAQTVDIIRRGYLLKGMNKDQVKAAWGSPCLSCPGTTSGSWGAAWEYPTQIVFFDRQEKVLRWEPK